MPTPILATKLYVPPPRANLVLRPRLVERLNACAHGGLTLIAAPAGYGKSTLLSEWIDQCAREDPKLHVAWLSLDEGDSDPYRFLLYLAAALHGAESSCGAEAMAALQSSQPPSAESILTDSDALRLPAAQWRRRAERPELRVVVLSGLDPPAPRDAGPEAWIVRTAEPNFPSGACPQTIGPRTASGSRPQLLARPGARVVRMHAWSRAVGSGARRLSGPRRQARAGCT